MSESLVGVIEPATRQNAGRAEKVVPSGAVNGPAGTETAAVMVVLGSERPARFSQVAAVSHPHAPARASHRRRAVIILDVQSSAGWVEEQAALLRQAAGLYNVPVRLSYLCGLAAVCGLAFAAPQGTAFNARDNGAKGDGKTDDTAALQKIIDDAGARGGGTAYVPPGDYAIRPIELRSGVTLYLEAGATLIASGNLADYPLETQQREGESARVGLITVRHCHNVTIAGHGAIEGSGLLFVDATRVKTADDSDLKYTRQGADFMNPKFGTQDGPWVPVRDRPGNLLRVMDSEDFELTGVTVRNSPAWTCEMYHSRNINIHHARIHSLTSNLHVPNDDGIDVNGCERVHISDMDIQTGDDCIALFSGNNITVANSTLRSRSAGVRIGYYAGTLRDVVINNVVIDDSNRGINLNVRNGNVVESVLLSNITIHTRLITGQWWGKGEPIVVTAMVNPRNPGTVGAIHGVHFRDIRIDSEAGVLIYGERPGMIEDLGFDGIHERIHKGPLEESYGGNFDLRGNTRPELALFGHDIPAWFAHGVTGLALHDVGVEWEDGLPPFYTHAVEIEDSKDIDLRNVRGKAARPGIEPMLFERCEGVRSTQ